MFQKFIEEQTVGNELLKDIKELMKSFLCRDVRKDNGTEKEEVRDMWKRRGYLEEELVTVKEARGILKVSRWKIDDLRSQKVLTTVDKEDIAGVRLIRSEVEALLYSYSRPKGKI